VITKTCPAFGAPPDIPIWKGRFCPPPQPSTRSCAPGPRWGPDLQPFSLPRVRCIVGGWCRSSTLMHGSR